ncbi:MAG: alpha/beta fold hydrolase [Alteripontixanthobacter sp.]
MPQATANGLTLEYETFGDEQNPPLLLVMGLGAQMTLWPLELIEALVERGFHVIRYDNRDIGLSQKFDGAKIPNIALTVLMARIGLTPRTPYTLGDMADDAVGLLDSLGIDKAHIVGASMGGMIAQHIASTHAERTLSLCSIMSTTGHRKLPPADKEAIRVLTKRPESTDMDVLIEHGLKISRTIGSPAYPAEESRLRQRIRGDMERSIYPEGMQRQLAAILADGDRRAQISGITAPTLVLHGEDDPLVPLSGGQDTAAHIPGAKLHTIPGMGHDLPLELVDEVADAIAGNAQGAGRSEAEAA